MKTIKGILHIETDYQRVRYAKIVAGGRDYLFESDSFWSVILKEHRNERKELVYNMADGFHRGVIIYERLSKLVFIEFNKEIHFEVTPLAHYASMLSDFTLKALPEKIDIDNYNLRLNKLAPYVKIDAKKEFDFHNHHMKEGKKVIDLGGAINQLNFYRSIQGKLTQQVRNQNVHSSSINVSNNFRLTVGLGNESVYESGITLHHVYGIPYIPGSAVKGITRSWLITEVFNADEKEAEKNDLFAHLFGKSGDAKDEGGNKGNAYFFDAFPTAVPTIEPDIMNNHHQDYYEDKGNLPPADWMNPNPVFFLTVKGGEFCFHIGVKENLSVKALKEKFKDFDLALFKLPEGREPLFDDNAFLLDILIAWVKDALAHHGIGAKTAVGYGRMKSNQ